MTRLGSLVRFQYRPKGNFSELPYFFALFFTFFFGRIYISLKDYDSAISYYSAAISKGKKSYTAPICYYNIGSCYEELNKLSDAVEAYKTAAEFDEFGMAPHAYFSQGRVLEAIGDFTGAAEAYNTLKSKFPEDSWSNLATTRLIELQIQGKAE